MYCNQKPSQDPGVFFLIIPFQVNDLNNGKSLTKSNNNSLVYARGCLARKLDAGIYPIV